MTYNFFTTAIVCFLLSSSINLFAQKDFLGKAYYETKTTIDMSSFGGGQLSEERKKQMAERMKGALEKTYILIFNQSESLYKEEERLEAPKQGGGMRFAMMNVSGGAYYKNLKTQQVLQENEFFGKQFLIKDSLPKLDWKLESETKTIGQYICFKATTLIKKSSARDLSNFMRRPPENEKSKDSSDIISDENNKDKVVVTAWYTPQIPVNQGPDNYWGLPGLILEVSSERTTILCSKIILNPSNKESIRVPSKGKEVTQEEYDAIVKKKSEEMADMFRSRRGGGSDSRGGGGRR